MVPKPENAAPPADHLKQMNQQLKVLHHIS